MTLTPQHTNGNAQPHQITHATAEGFAGEFDGTWNDASNFANIAQSFGLMPKGEEEGNGTGDVTQVTQVTQVNLLDPNMTPNQNPNPNQNASPSKKKKVRNKIVLCVGAVLL